MGLWERLLQLKNLVPYGLAREPVDPDTLVERGSAGTEMYGRFVPWLDYNPKLSGEQGLATYEQMRKSDASIRSVLQACKLPLLRATWKVTPAVESEADETDKEIAHFCSDAILGEAASGPAHSHTAVRLAGSNKVQTWRGVLKHVLLMLDFGFTVFEKVWDTDDDGRLTLARLAPRLPQTISQIEVDQFGFVKSVFQRAYKNGRQKEVEIPAPYVFVLTHDREGDNHWGVSLLRYAYKHWYYKDEAYRINMVRLDRFGVGIPRAKIAAGYQLKVSEQKALEELLQGLRSHHRGYVITPEEIDVSIMTPENEAGGASGVLDFVDHQDIMISRMVLANFLTAGVQKHGN